MAPERTRSARAHSPARQPGVLIAFGVILVLFCSVSWFHALRSKNWQPVEASIGRSISKEKYFYTYTANGRSYRGDRIVIAPRQIRLLQPAIRRSANKVQIYYDPQRPRRSVMYPGIRVIAICAVLFFALRGLEDPSRRPGRILSTDAGRRAVEILRARDSRFLDFDVVHVAWARAGEGAAEERWVVLADRLPRSALREAVVVELRASDGSLLRIRRPVR